MDLNQLIAWGLTFVLGIGVVSAVIKKYGGQANTLK